MFRAEEAWCFAILNVKKLKQVGTIILLTARPETILSRVSGSEERPILNGNMNVAFIQNLMEKRQPFYEAAADFIVSTDGKSASEVANEILGHFQ